MAAVVCWVNIFVWTSEQNVSLKNLADLSTRLFTGGCLNFYNIITQGNKYNIVKCVWQSNYSEQLHVHYKFKCIYSCSGITIYNTIIVMMSLLLKVVLFLTVHWNIKYIVTTDSKWLHRYYYEYVPISVNWGNRKIRFQVKL